MIHNKFNKSGRGRRGCGCDGTQPVSRKQPNICGLYDIHGKFREWSEKWYGAYPSGKVTNPTGSTTGSYRVFRVGSWSYLARTYRSAFCICNWPDYAGPSYACASAVRIS